MSVLGVLTISAAGDDGMRYVLLALVFVAIVLLIVGAAIAVITWRNQLRRVEVRQLERENT